LVMRRSSTAFLLLLLGQAAGFTPNALPLRLRAAPVQAHPIAVLPCRVGLVSMRSASAASGQPPASPVTSALKRVMLALTASLLSVLMRVGRAFAASTRSAASAAPFAISGNHIKWGVVVLGCGCAYIFRREEEPILTFTETVESSGEATPAASSSDVDGLAGDDAASLPSIQGADDSMINSALFSRMQELASQASEEGSDDNDANAPPPPDSSDGWGTGDTATLERPSSNGDSPPPTQEGGGLFDGEPAVEFPTGFPLVNEPAGEASAEQIEMMKRMFGTSS